LALRWVRRKTAYRAQHRCRGEPVLLPVPAAAPGVPAWARKTLGHCWQKRQPRRWPILRERPRGPE